MCRSAAAFHVSRKRVQRVTHAEDPWEALLAAAVIFDNRTVFFYRQQRPLRRVPTTVAVVVAARTPPVDPITLCFSTGSWSLRRGAFVFYYLQLFFVTYYYRFHTTLSPDAEHYYRFQLVGCLSVFRPFDIF